MRLQIFRLLSRYRNKNPNLLPTQISRSFSDFPSPSPPPPPPPSLSERPSFGIAFDIDGVVLLGHAPIGGSPNALRRLYDHSGNLQIPFVFLTNGGGFHESRRASELSGLLGVNILPLQVIQGHSPFKQLVKRFEDGLVVAVGKGEPAAVMSEYGFKKVLSIDEYTCYFDDIDPLGQYKKWATKKVADQDGTVMARTKRKDDVQSQRVHAAFIVSDSIDWSRDIQVLCDILRTGGLPGRGVGVQPDLFFANDDLDYQAKFPAERLGMGAFRVALEAIFNSIHPTPLTYTSYGKPNPFVFKNAERMLSNLMPALKGDLHREVIPNTTRKFKTLYMIGDNPKIDIKGARLAGDPWFSILTRTGVFKGKENHLEFPADLVVDTVDDAVEFVLEREGASLPFKVR